MITKENKAEAISKLARSKKDVGSPEVQVSILTERIKEVTEHVKSNKHDFMARRGLMQMVGRRKKLLKYLEKNNSLIISSSSVIEINYSLARRKNLRKFGDFLYAKYIKRPSRKSARAFNVLLQTS